MPELLPPPSAVSSALAAPPLMHSSLAGKKFPSEAPQQNGSPRTTMSVAPVPVAVKSDPRSTDPALLPAVEFMSGARGGSPQQRLTHDEKTTMAAIAARQLVKFVRARAEAKIKSLREKRCATSSSSAAPQHEASAVSPETTVQIHAQLYDHAIPQHVIPGCVKARKRVFVPLPGGVGCCD